MKAGYKITEIDIWGDLKEVFVVDNYSAVNEVTIRASKAENIPLLTDEYTTAVFHIRQKVPCDHCGQVTKDKPNDEGYVYCEKCEDNLNEQAAERYYNDAENFTTNDYSQYKSLK